MTDVQKQRIIITLAYLYNEMYKYFNTKTNDEKNWKRAEEAFEIELKINGERWLLDLIKEKENE